MCMTTFKAKVNIKNLLSGYGHVVTLVNYVIVAYQYIHLVETGALIPFSRLYLFSMAIHEMITVHT